MFCGILLILLIAYTQQYCSTVQETTSIYPTVQEHFRWRADQFITGSGLAYTFDHAANLIQFHPPVDKIDTEADILNQQQQSGLRALDDHATGAWKNHFAFLEYDNSAYDIFYAQGNQWDMDKTPQFKEKITFPKKTNLVCYDLDYMESDKWIVDCSYGDGESAFQNLVYIAYPGISTNQLEASAVETPNVKNYKKITGRKIVYHVYYKSNIGQDQEDNIDAPKPTDPIRVFLRGQTAHNSETGTATQLDNDCIIDLLTVDETGAITDTGNHLDKARISQDIGTTVNFTLIDFKILPVGDIYILDAENGIYKYRISDNNWKFVQKIQTLNSQAYGFDINYRLLNNGKSYLHLAVLYQQNLLTFLDFKQQNGYNLPFTVQFPVEIYLSQGYIVIINQAKLYLYNSELPQLLYSKLMGAQDFIVNPYAPDLIEISTYEVTRYELSDGYISTENEVATGQGTITFSGTDGTSTCVSTIKYQILSANDIQLYDLEHDPFPEKITYPAEAFLLQDIVSGPNLHYTTPDVSQTHVQVDVHFLWELSVKGINWYDPKDVIYADILVDPHHTTNNKFYLFLQHTNKTVYIWDCQTENYNDQDCTCEKQDTFNLPVQLNRQNSQFDWQSSASEDLTFQFLENDYEIGIYTSVFENPEKLFSITLTAKDANKITSFTALEENIFVVLGNSKVVNVYVSIVPLYYYPIDQDVMNDFGLNSSICSWTPKQVFGNPDTRSEFAFILTDDCLIMGDQRYHFILIDYFPIRKEAEVTVAVGEKSFFIISTLNGVDLIEEYNYQNLNDIYLMKSLPMYDKYRLQTPLTVDFAYDTGFLFVRAFDKVNSETVFLVYESNILYHNSLFKVIHTHENIADGQLIQTCATGLEQMFIYFNDKKTQKIVVALQDSVMELTPNQMSEAYVTSLNAAVSISNTFDGSTPKAVKYPVKFINTQSIIRLNQTLLSSENQTFNPVDTAQFVNITNNGWYFGHVARFSIQCKQCDTHAIQILDPVHFSSDGTDFDNIDIIAGALFQNTMVYLSDQQLSFQNDNDTLMFVYKFQDVNYCDQLTIYNNYIFTACSYNGENVIVLLQCDLTKKTCTAQDPKYQVLSNVQTVSKLQYLDGVLYVLDSNPSLPGRYSGAVHVYDLSLDGKWSIKNDQLLNAAYFGVDETAFYISDFDVVKFQVGNTFYYKVFIQVLKDKTYFAQLYSSSGSAKLNDKDSFALATALDQDFAIMTNTQFYQIRAIKQSIESSILSVTVIITTSNVAQYGVTFSFDISDPLNKGSKVKSTIQIPFLLNSYGTLTTINKFDHGQGYAAVPYKNSTHVFVTIYKIPDLSEVGFGAETTTKMITITGGQLSEYWNVPTSFCLVISNDPIHNEPVFYTNIHQSLKTKVYMLVKYSIHDFPRIEIIGGSKVTTQDVTITIENDYSTATGVIKLTNKINPNPDPDDNGSSLTWLWILLGVLGGLAILGVVGFFIYTKFFKKNQYVTDSAKVSLMAK